MLSTTPSIISPHMGFTVRPSVTANLCIMDGTLVRCLTISWSVLCFVLQEMENAWNEYSRLERDVDWLKSALQGQMSRSDLTQVWGSLISVITHTHTHKQVIHSNGRLCMNYRLLLFLCFSVSSKRKSRSEKSCGGLRMSSQASAPVKPTTKSLSPPSPTQVRQVRPGGFLHAKQMTFAACTMQGKQHGQATVSSHWSS